MLKYASLAALVAAVSVAPAFAQDADEIVVTASRGAGVPRDQLGGSVTLFSFDDLEQRQVQSVADLLRDSPGVAVNRSGPLGAATQVRIRGAEGNHTLVLIDGMDVSDPYFQEFDFATLIADDVARVEVLRGQQSALYGSDAIGGVVQYITATGAEAPGVRLRAEYGSFDASEVSARVAGVNGALDYALSAATLSTEGVPSAPNGSRDLGYDSTSASVRLGYRVSDALTLTGIVRARAVQGEYNWNTDENGLIIDTPGTHYEDDAVYALARADLALGAWAQSLTVQGVDGDRTERAPGSFTDYSHSQGRRWKASYVSDLHFGGDHLDQHLIGAVDYKRDFFKTLDIPQQAIASTGLVLQYQGVLANRFAFGAAVRRDLNDRFDDDTTYRVQASYALGEGTRLRAAAGSGVKNPTMSELFAAGGDYIGNPDLSPEESRGWEAGVEQTLLGGAALVGITYFDNKLTREIVMDFSNFPLVSSRNLDSDSTERGVEVFANARFGRQWRVDFAYTNLDAKQDGVTEVRRAKNIASLNVNWQSPGESFGANLNIRYNGEQDDNQFLFGPPFVVPVKLKAFTLVSIGADWRLTQRLSLYGRVENALDEDYQEVFGYAEAGRSATLGVRAAF